MLERRLRDALTLLNPKLPITALDESYRKLTRAKGSTLEARNRAFHRMLVNGMTVESRILWWPYPRRPGGGVRLL